MKDISIAYLIIALLATYRLTSLFKYEVGPWKILTKFRMLFGIIHDSKGFPHGYPETLFGELFECYYCLSVWVGGIVTLAMVLGLWWLMLPLALSGGAMLCVEAAEK